MVVKNSGPTKRSRVSSLVAVPATSILSEKPAVNSERLERLTLRTPGIALIRLRSSAKKRTISGPR